MDFAKERFIKQVGFAFAICALFSAVWIENVKMREWDTGRVAPPEDSVRWNPTLARVMSFGQIPAVVDWMWLRLLQDADLSHVRGGKHPSIYYDLVLATELDPAYFEAYKVGANFLSIIRDDNSGARELIIKAQDFAHSDLQALGPSFAEHFWSPAWSIPMTRAYLELFEFNNLPAAAAAFTEASQMSGSPAYLQHLTSRLATRAGQYEVGAKLLQFTLGQVKATNPDPDNESLTRIQHKIASFEISRFLFQINEQFAAYQADLRQHRSPLGRDPERALTAFLSAQPRGGQDPAGGQLKLDAKGRIITSTPHDNVLGLEE